MFLRESRKGALGTNGLTKIPPPGLVEKIFEYINPLFGQRGLQD